MKHTKGYLHKKTNSIPFQATENESTNGTQYVVECHFLFSNGKNISIEKY